MNSLTTLFSSTFLSVLTVCMLLSGSVVNAASNQASSGAQVLITSPLTATSTESVTLSGAAYNVNVVSLNVKGKISNPSGAKYAVPIDKTVQVPVLNNQWSYTFEDGFPGRQESLTGNGYNLTITVFDAGTNKKLLTQSLWVKPKPTASVNVTQNKKIQYGYQGPFHSVAYMPINVSGNASFTDKLHVNIIKHPNPTAPNATPITYSYVVKPKTVQLPHTFIRRDWNISNILISEGGAYTIIVRNKSSLGEKLYEENMSVEGATGALYKPENVFAVNMPVTIFGTSTVLDRAFCRVTNTNGQIVVTGAQFNDGKCSTPTPIRTQGNYKVELLVGTGVNEKELSETTFTVGVKPTASASITEPTSVTLGNSIQYTKIAGTATGVNAVNLYIQYPTGGAPSITNIPVSGGKWSTSYRFTGAGIYTLRITANGYTGSLVEREVVVSDANSQSVTPTPPTTPTPTADLNCRIDYPEGANIRSSHQDTQNQCKVYCDTYGSTDAQKSGGIAICNFNGSKIASYTFSETPTTPTASITSALSAVAGTLNTISGIASGVTKLNITNAYPTGGSVSTNVDVVNGQWKITYNAPFTEIGTYIITILGVWAGGNETLSKDVLTITAPIAVTPTASITSSLTSLYANTAFTISGAASNVTKVSVKVTNIAGTAVSNTTPSVTNGVWSVGITSGLPAGSYTTTVRADSSTGAVLATKTFSVTVKPTTNSTTNSPLPSMNSFVPIRSASIESPYTCIDLKTNMHRGAESSAVLSLQKFLVQKGYLTEEPTAFYGDFTVEAVKAYQKGIGLPQTGMVYEYTRAAIKNNTCSI